MSANRTSLPRFGLVLAVLLPLAALLLWWLAHRSQADPFTLGGPLLPWSPEQVEELTLTRGGAQYRIERSEGGVWRLTGALVDFADAERVDKLLQALAAAQGGPLLPGSEPEDRRYEFNGPEAMRLAVFGPDAEAWRLSLGAVNPVTGFVYASGAGRSACFPVENSLRDRLLKLPDEVRATTLLPDFRLSAVQSLILGGAADLVLRRDEAGWWLRWNPDERVGPGGLAGAYQKWYGDRRLGDAQGRWLRANDDAISLLLFQTSSQVVRRFVPPSEAEPNLAAWGLEPPYRRVVMEGPELVAGPITQKIEIDFGASLDGDQVAAQRLENVLMTDDTALKKLEWRAVDLLDLAALSFPVVQADSLEVSYEGRLILAGHRDPAATQREIDTQHGDLDRVDGRRAWVADYPAPGPALDPGATDVRLQTVVITLDRLPILAVFAPQSTPAALAPAGRARVRIARGGGRPAETLLIGTLVAGSLPPGSSAPAPDPDGIAPTVLWRPGTGQLLQVPAAFLTTLRNLSL